ncbi:MAG: hypothetical protein DMG17_29450 [Acidobacteria bacterium]|nr:MAG: hypothetical protein DMG17_29450 [Acidobacteriota bacterium]
MSAGQCDEKDRLVLDTAERQELYSAAVAELSRRIGITSLDETHAFGRRAAVLGSFLADGNRDNSGASHDPTLQGLVANAGAFLYGHVVRSGKQKVWCLDGYQLQGRIGTGK